MKRDSRILMVPALALLAVNLARADDSTFAPTPTNAARAVAPDSPPASNDAGPWTTNMAVTVPPAPPAAPPTNTVVVTPAPVVVAAAPTPAPVIEEPKPSYHRLSIGAEIGTTGGGANAHLHLADHFGIGAAYDRLAFSFSSTIDGNPYHSHVRLMTVPVTFDWYPLDNDYLRVSAGIVINKNHFTGTTSGTVDLNGTPYSGTANLSVKQQPINQYLAVGGNFYFDHDHHFSMNGELGLIFTGEPRVHLTLNPPNGAVETARQQEEARIRRYARYAQVWPVLKLSLSYSF